ncbi:N-6 DNA methylase [Mesorhizobium sp. M0478]|uniref:Eco57I restriction-modification methylase domain-containing protein n=1 Tax=Mesorhizobium sp. M0478 TaxID=2956947 RepID=UPI00333C0A8E
MIHKRDPLFKKRILKKILRAEEDRGVAVPQLATERIAHWVDQLRRGVLDKMTESSAEQTFNQEIFGTVLGYEQIGTAVEASLMPKRTGPSGRDIPDFVLGRFDLSAGLEEWAVVGEIKGSKTDLDQPQMGRSNKETPVEQAFRYATKGRAGVEWILVTNFREVRLYKNGYAGNYHGWNLEELIQPSKLFEFYALLRPEGLLNRGREPIASRAFQESILAGRDLTEGFYGLYKAVQEALIAELSGQPASVALSRTDLYGKTHKLLNRVLFIAFCQQHPAELVPRDTLRQVVNRARANSSSGSYWREYKELFRTLNTGGGLGGMALNAFNGGLFAEDPYFDAIEIPTTLFTRRFRAGKGRRQSLEITGIFGFDIYDFGEDLNVQALGAIFEQSLKDIEKGEALVRGVGEMGVSSQESGGVYYTPREITAHMVRGAFELIFEEFAGQAESSPVKIGKAMATPSRSGDRRTKTAYFTSYASKLRTIKVMDPACGSGAFLVEALDQLQSEYDKVNRALSELTGAKGQLSLLDLDRVILRENLLGRDILAESVEITRLSIWLRTAKRGEKLETLDQTIVTGDSLRSTDHNIYDAVIGNPPWGATLDGWDEGSLVERFPSSGSEIDSYAIFVIRAWEMLKVGGVLAFIIPNSWLTVNGYSAFRDWLLQAFEFVEVTNVWKVFADVNHDASILIARKRPMPIALVPPGSPDGVKEFRVQAVERGRSESVKLKQLAEATWAIGHRTTHDFQYGQTNHRFEVIYPQKAALELDQIAARCRRLDAVADVTVGIQVYHHTKVPKEFIKRRGFHSAMREGSDWYPYIDANDVQRYYSKESTTQWLHFNDRLRDKRDLAHYAEPRILVQQIFWRRLSAVLQAPTEPEMYLNTLFAIYNARGVTLACVLALLNSRFITGSYERRANRLFGDKFPKVSKIDLASVPIPRMSPATMAALGDAALDLQAKWQGLRDALRDANVDLSAAHPEATLSELGEFWTLSEAAFLARASKIYGPASSTRNELLRSGYTKAKTTIDTLWHIIRSREQELEVLVRNAYRVNEEVYSAIIARTPPPEIEWALRS